MHGSSASAHRTTRLCDPCPHVLLQALHGEYCTRALQSGTQLWTHAYVMQACCASRGTSAALACRRGDSKCTCRCVLFTSHIHEGL